MPTVCIQCALEAFVKSQDLDPKDVNIPGVFDETPEAHMARVHPNGVDPAVRKALELQAMTIIAAKEQS